jgi:ketosteroid isomerase-like protein
MKKILTAAVLAFALIGPAVAAEDAMTDCENGAKVWNDAYNKRDAETLANQYDAKTGTFSTDYWTATGHDALLAGFKQMVAGAGGLMETVKCEHAERRGDVNVNTGTYALTGKAPDGSMINATGHWVVIGSPGKNGLILTHLANEQKPPPK